MVVLLVRLILFLVILLEFILISKVLGEVEGFEKILV